MTGAICVVLSSSHVKQDYTLRQLLLLYQRPLFITYFSILLASLAAVFIKIYVCDKDKNKEYEQQKLDKGASTALVTSENDPSVAASDCDANPIDARFTS